MGRLGPFSAGLMRDCGIGRKNMRDFGIEKKSGSGFGPQITRDYGKCAKISRDIGIKICNGIEIEKKSMAGYDLARDTRIGIFLFVFSS